MQSISGIQPSSQGQKIDSADPNDRQNSTKQLSPRVDFSCLRPKIETPDVSSLNTSISSQANQPRITYNQSLEEAVLRNSNKLSPEIREKIQEAKDAVRKDPNRASNSELMKNYQSNPRPNTGYMPQKPSEIINSIHEKSLGISSPDKKNKSLLASKDLKLELEMSELKLQTLAKRIEECLSSTKNAIRISQKLRDGNRSNSKSPNNKRLPKSNPQTPSPARAKTPKSKDRNTTSPGNTRGFKLSPNKKIEEIAEWIKNNSSVDKLPDANKTMPSRIKESQTPQKNRPNQDAAAKKAHKRTSSQPFQSQENVAVDPVPQRPNISSIDQSSKGIITKSPSRPRLQENQGDTNEHIKDQEVEKTKKSGKPGNINPKENVIKKVNARRGEVEQPVETTKSSNITVQNERSPVSQNLKGSKIEPNASRSNPQMQTTGSIKMEDTAEKIEKGQKKPKPVMKRYILKKKEPKEGENVQQEQELEMATEPAEVTKKSGKPKPQSEPQQNGAGRALKYNQAPLENTKSSNQETLRSSQEFNPMRSESPIMPDQSIRLQTSPNPALKSTQEEFRSVDSKPRTKTESNEPQAKKVNSRYNNKYKAGERTSTEPQELPVKAESKKAVNARDSQKSFKSPDKFNPRASAASNKREDEQTTKYSTENSNVRTSNTNVAPKYNTNSPQQDIAGARSSQRQFETKSSEKKRNVQESSNENVKIFDSARQEPAQGKSEKIKRTVSPNTRNTSSNMPKSVKSPLSSRRENTANGKNDDQIKESNNKATNQAKVKETNDKNYNNNLEYLKWLRKSIKNNYENITETMENYEETFSQENIPNSESTNTITPTIKQPLNKQDVKKAIEPYKNPPVPEKAVQNPNQNEKKQRKNTPKKETKMPFLNDIEASKYVASLIDRLKHSNKITEK